MVFVLLESISSDFPYNLVSFVLSLLPSAPFVLFHCYFERNYDKRITRNYDHRYTKKGNDFKFLFVFLFAQL